MVEERDTTAEVPAAGHTPRSGGSASVEATDVDTPSEATDVDTPSEAASPEAAAPAPPAHPPDVAASPEAAAPAPAEDSPGEAASSATADAAHGADTPAESLPPKAAPSAPDGAAPEDPAAPVEHDLDELAALARERDEYLSLAQRTQADFENFRKRKAREVSEAERRGVTRLARELLPALDSLELAVAQLPEEARRGVKLVYDDVVAALARVGIEGFSPEGEPFDPNEHDAMASHPVEGAESGTVAEVYQRGYRLNGGVLRPARVVVAE